MEKASPQTKEELYIARENLKEELREKNLTGVPSVDKAWSKFYKNGEMNIDIPKMSLVEYLYERNKNNMSINAIDYFGKKITYEELFYRIEDTAKRFKKMGVMENDYINLAMPVSPETIYMIYGLDYIGAAACLIDPRVNNERMEYYMNLVSSKFLGITGIYASTMRSALNSTTGAKMINFSPFQTFNGTEKLSLKSLYNMKMLLEHLKEIKYNLTNTNNNRILSSKRFYNVNVNDIILNEPVYYDGKVSIGEYTSGTTGVPKGLELSSSAMNLLVEQLKYLIKTNPGDTILGILPPFISYGAVCGIHNAFCSGLENIMIPTFTPEQIPKLILTKKPNNIVCVPMYLQLLMESNLVTSETDLSFIKNIIVGGSKTEASFEIAFNEWLKNHNGVTHITKGGGMAEYSSCLFYTPTRECCTPGIYGIPLPKVEVKITDDKNQELGYYEIGEIQVSSEQAMNGYINNIQATNEFFYYDNNGKKWGKTGDLGYIDTDGQITLINRKKQMLIRPDSHNVFPSEIEQVIRSHYAVKNCLVVGKKDPNYISGEWPTAYIELKKEYNNECEKYLNEIKKLCTQKLPLRDRPRESDYYLIKKVINTMEGKVNEQASTSEENIIKKKLKR